MFTGRKSAIKMSALKTGDAIRVEGQGRDARLDYVQFNTRETKPNRPLIPTDAPALNSTFDCRTELPYAVWQHPGALTREHIAGRNNLD